MLRSTASVLVTCLFTAVACAQEGAATPPATGSGLTSPRDRAEQPPPSVRPPIANRPPVSPPIAPWPPITPPIAPRPPVMPPIAPRPPIMPPPPSASTVDPARELLITDVSVVDDPVLTDATTTPPGAWSFRALVEGMVGAQAAPDLVLGWLRTWERDQTINGFKVPARPQLRALVTEPWLARSGGKRLDLSNAPFRLLAIVNRIDLRSDGGGYGGGGVIGGPIRAADAPADGVAQRPIAPSPDMPPVMPPPARPLHAGEGRFVFGLLDPQGRPMSFTVILEYQLPAADDREVLGWARSWHQLGQVPFGPRYNRLLSMITRRFTRRGAAPARPHGSALNQVRTNEVALTSPWELREFTLDAKAPTLAPATVKQTPDASLNGSPALADLINQNEAMILAGRFLVPAKVLGGASPVDRPWSAAGVKSSDARHLLAVNTCSGCHQAETGTAFLHVGVRAAGQRAQLSGFLTGTTVRDPISGEPRSFADLKRRADDLEALRGGGPVPVPVPGVAAGAAPGAADGAANGAATLAPGVRIH